MGTNCAVGEANGGPGVTSNRLDFGELDRCAAFFFANGLAAFSQKTYKSVENHYVGFCQCYSIVPLLPVSESVLCKFVAYLADQGLKYRTIKTFIWDTLFAD